MQLEVPSVGSALPPSTPALPDPRIARLAFVRSAHQCLKSSSLDCGAREFKNWLASKLHVSDRVAGRWLRTAQFTPLCVQDAVDDGRLDITTAEKVSGCSSEVKNDIAERIESGKDPKAVIAAYLSPKFPNSVACVRRMLRAVNRCMADLDGHFDTLPPVCEKEKVILANLEEFIRKLADKRPASVPPQSRRPPGPYSPNARE